jgi:hypothetical protein
MVYLEALIKERAKLTIRNAEIKKLRDSCGFTNKELEEYSKLCEEEKVNTERIREITQIIRDDR